MSLRVATVTGDPEEEARLVGVLSATDEVELYMRCVDRVETLAVVRSGAVDALLIAGLPVWFDAELLNEARAADLRLVASPSDPLQAEHLRTLDVPLIDDAADVPTIVRTCRETPAVLGAQADLRPSGDGRLVAVWGPKGAPGRTTLAIELAYAMAERDPSTLLIDADPSGGDVAQVVGVVEELPGLVWATRSASKGAWASLVRELRRLADGGPVLLPGVSHPGLGRDVNEFGWEALLKDVRGLFHTSVVDVGGDLGSSEEPARITRAALEGADHVVAVCRADPVGVKQFLIAYPRLCEMVPSDRVVVVANRVRGGQSSRVGDLLRSRIGKKPAAYVPDVPEEIDRGILLGRAIREVSPGSSLVMSVDLVAERLGVKVPARGFLSRLGGRR